MNKCNYWKRLRDMITFLFIWIAPCTYAVHVTNSHEYYMLTLITWLPAIFITQYLTDCD